MRKYTLLLLLPILGFAQTPAERQKIVSTYDQAVLSQLKSEAAAYMQKQRELIAQYKATHDVEESETHSLQRIHDGIPHFFTIYNDGAAKTIRANSMYTNGSLGLDVDGTGLFAGVWDGGKVRDTHQEFPSSKVMPSDGAGDLSAHATHVTGTIIAAGTSASRRGIAHGANALTYDWDDDYDEMVSFAAMGYLVSNHSYGYSVTGIPIWKFGQYDASSVEVDMESAANPYYQVVIAAGNDRNDFSVEQPALESGYDLLTGTATSKNGITVAAVHELLNYEDPSSVMMSEFSNYGPPDDGRVKPDISAKGVNVSSSISSSNAAYDNYNGTSMAAPAISGLILLLQNHYNNLTGNYMRASTVRGLLCHSAREAGFNPGPDYEFGWGLADGETAAQIITDNGSAAIIEEHTLNNTATFTKVINISEFSKLQVTIAWTDPAGTANGSGAEDTRTARLRNNLDLKVIYNGITYYPYSLNADDPYAPAQNFEDNNVDNVERVDIDFADPGSYTIQVKHKGNLHTGAPQNFSLIASTDTGVNLGADSRDFADNIVLYPNPVRNTLNFSVPQNAEVSNVSMFDVVGKEVRVNSQMVGSGIDVSTLTSGVYFAKFQVDGKPVVRKFIKE